MKTLIIEDEPLVAKDLQKLLQQIDNQIVIQAVLPSVESAKDWFETHREPDLLFMDIQLSDGVSFDLFDWVKIDCPIIFTTAYNEYAIRAFKVNSLDYLLKPIDKQDLKQALEKYRRLYENKTELPNFQNQLSQFLQDLKGSEKKYKERFIVHYKNALVPITMDKVAYFLKDELIYVVTIDNQKLVSQYETLEEVEDMLNPAVFFRATRQHIIRLDWVDSYKTNFNGKLTLKLKNMPQESIDISREKAPIFKKWLEG
ncbi:MAG: LytTR family DNA-binding domain-containing protein [Microscillaceae bacterium]|nr:LytTR family DNA-binding domain-containing protein [Microscillaceae bacterium]